MAVHTPRMQGTAPRDKSVSLTSFLIHVRLHVRTEIKLLCLCLYFPSRLRSQANDNDNQYIPSERFTADEETDSKYLF